MALRLRAATTRGTTQRRASSSLARREELYGWLFASPWIIGFILFTAGPMLASFYLGFTEYSIANPPSSDAFPHRERRRAGPRISGSGSLR